jgi:hypothetical protein
MTKRIAAALACAAALAATGASAADSGYGFKVKNETGAAVTVTVDNQAKCTLAAGGDCTLLVKDMDGHVFAYAAADAAPVKFAPGNLEMVDLCRIDATGAHCADTQGTATN